MRRWPGFRSDFVARFSPAGSTGCGRQMALQLGVNGQGHTDTSTHKANQFCRWQQGTGSTQVLRRCVGQAKITSDSEGGRRIRCRWAFTPPAPIALTLHCRPAASGSRRLYCRNFRHTVRSGFAGEGFGKICPLALTCGLSSFHKQSHTIFTKFQILQEDHDF